MALHHQRRASHLPHLSIANMPLASFDGPSMFSPAIQTQLAQQTFRAGHRSSPSLAHLAITPGALPPHLAMAAMSPLALRQPSSPFPATPGFPPRNRRQPSVSIGGPPKAALGGAGRNYTPSGGGPAVGELKAPVRRSVVKLPVETEVDAQGNVKRISWARTALPRDDMPEQSPVYPPELTTSDAYPPNWRDRPTPDNVDIFLPGQGAWKTLRDEIIEEKLQRLGVEKGNGHPPAHLMPHARSQSISSPADPALLMFKLNKLHASQANSSGGSKAPSPQPPSPNPEVPPRFQQRHAQSMSLAQPIPSHLGRQTLYNPSGSFNPFGPEATLGSDEIRKAHSETSGTPYSELSVPGHHGRPRSTGVDGRPDFVRGFGLDIPEEDEEDAAFNFGEPRDVSSPPRREGLNAVDSPPPNEEEDEDSTTASPSQHHTRHVSRISVALSIKSVTQPVRETEEFHYDKDVPSEAPDDLDADAVGEWTGSEDVRNDEESDMGDEYSNPSDEERARQARVQKRQSQPDDPEMPRRIPNFPPPPDVRYLDRRFDDEVSNPSDEDHHRNYGIVESHADHSSSSVFQRPLPPLPHSRTTSYLQETIGRHSHSSSRKLHSPHNNSMSHPIDVPDGVFRRRDSLNPLAKPFVFGERSTLIDTVAAVVEATVPTHQRLPSLSSRILNADAPVFKPNFTFQPPEEAPSISVPQPETSRPLPVPPLLTDHNSQSSDKPEQGREKRMRRSSIDTPEIMSPEVVEQPERNNMTTFQFPSPERQKVSEPATELRPATLGLNPAAKPFTFGAGLNPVAKPFTFNASAAVVSSEKTHVTAGSNASQSYVESEMDLQPVAAVPLEAPQSATKPKRTPIPLDFVSTNTVPAGLFKAFMGDSEGTRSTGRSRRESRDGFDHSSAHSLDDNAIPTISRGRNALATGESIVPLKSPAVPMAPEMPPSMNHPAVLANKTNQQHVGSKRSVEEVSEVLESFKRQMNEFGRPRNGHMLEHQSLPSLDVGAIKVLIEKSNGEIQSGLHHAVSDLRRRVEEGTHEGGLHTHKLLHAIDNIANRISSAILSSSSQLATCIEAVEQSAVASSADNHEALLHDFIGVVIPRLQAAQPPPVDYDILTSQLAQAVKPHISQLIDLASDKKETAQLIVNSLLPTLTTLASSGQTVDTASIISELSANMSRVIPPIDTHVIKEQVADLVVERLDSRLAVRDRQMNGEVVASLISRSVGTALEPVHGELRRMETTRQERALERSRSDTRQAEVLTRLSVLPDSLVDLQRLISSTHADFLQRPAQSTDLSVLDPHFKNVVNTISQLSDTNTQLSKQVSQSSITQDEAAVIIASLPNMLTQLSDQLREFNSEMATGFSTFKGSDDGELTTLRAKTAELQKQLRDHASSVSRLEMERDSWMRTSQAQEADTRSLQTRLDELQESTSKSVADNSAKVASLETALTHSADRLKISDSELEKLNEKITAFERDQKNASSQSQQLQNKVNKLEAEAKSSRIEKKSLTESLAFARKERDQAVAQQDQSDDLRRMATQMEEMASVIKAADTEETRVLKDYREKCLGLEGENRAMQKRVKDQDSKLANVEKASVTARQNLAQAQQRATEWEKRAKDLENDVLEARARTEEAEDARTQLDADHSLLKMQLTEKEDAYLAAKDKERAYESDVQELSSQIALLKHQLASATPSSPSPTWQVVNGHGAPGGYTASVSGRSTPRGGSPAPPPNIYDSIHNPHSSRNAPLAAPTPHLPMTLNNVAKLRGAAAPTRRRVASPAASVISAAPTLQEDGWYV